MLYFLPRGHETSGHFIFMGRDKVENEDLIKYGLPEDVWCAARLTASPRCTRMYTCADDSLSTWNLRAAAGARR